MENEYTLKYEDMVKAGMHFGRRKTVFHPNMKPFVYANKDNIQIIDLAKTNEALNVAVAEMKKVIQAGGKILFVGINKYSADAVRKTAETLEMPYVIERWLGGTLTNFKIITARVKYLENLEREQRETGFEKYTKKERLLKEKEIAKMRIKYDGIRKLDKLPEIVFVSSLKDGMLPIKEATMTGCKTVGIVNTDSDPKLLNFAIPANDNSAKSVELILNIIAGGLKKQPTI